MWLSQCGRDRVIETYHFRMFMDVRQTFVGEAERSPAIVSQLEHLAKVPPSRKCAARNPSKSNHIISDADRKWRCLVTLLYDAPSTRTALDCLGRVARHEDARHPVTAKLAVHAIGRANGLLKFAEVQWGRGRRWR